MATAVIRRNDLSGTGYTVDVTALELDSNVLIKDFIVSHNGVDRTSSYTKTNANTITYAGTSVTLGTLVNIERDTSLLPSETSFLSVTTASELTNALDKLRRRVEEADAYATYVSQQLLAAGISIGTIPILDNAYAASWDGDTTRAPSRNAVYDRLVTMPTNAELNTALALKANLVSPTFTGTPLAPTPATTDATTKIATTAFVAARKRLVGVSRATNNVQTNIPQEAGSTLNYVSIPVTAAVGDTIIAFANGIYVTDGVAGNWRSDFKITANGATTFSGMEILDTNTGGFKAINITDTFDITTAGVTNVRFSADTGDAVPHTAMFQCMLFVAHFS